MWAVHDLNHNWISDGKEDQFIHALFHTIGLIIICTNIGSDIKH